MSKTTRGAAPTAPPPAPLAPARPFSRVVDSPDGPITLEAPARQRLLWDILMSSSPSASGMAALGLCYHQGEGAPIPGSEPYKGQPVDAYGESVMEAAFSLWGSLEAVRLSYIAKAIVDERASSAKAVKDRADFLGPTTG